MIVIQIAQGIRRSLRNNLVNLRNGREKAKRRRSHQQINKSIPTFQVWEIWMILHLHRTSCLKHSKIWLQIQISSIAHRDLQILWKVNMKWYYRQMTWITQVCARNHCFKLRLVLLGRVHNLWEPLLIMYRHMVRIHYSSSNPLKCKKSDQRTCIYT